MQITDKMYSDFYNVAANVGKYVLWNSHEDAISAHRIHGVYFGEDGLLRYDLDMLHPTIDHGAILGICSHDEIGSKIETYFYKNNEV